ncbi:FecR domain-containing protein [Cyclobacterium sp.]|uniref:FecR domain-containing protein n=1 Tax=Cyclobacterium sp. TaxID=1966343 RepID=UPI0019B41092|nr:FecR domain-containing protein [Cyclobacterium sp.]MBD3628510.1 FecR domain-containing protein [Cyclobacterium sp.]
MEDQLLIKYLLGETDSVEAEEVEKWIAADVQNSRYFEQLRWIWENSARLLEKSEIDENEAWKQFKDRRVIIEAKNKTARHTVNLPVWLRVAAAIFLVLIGGWALMSNLPGPVRALYTGVVFETLEEPVKEVLMDGSVLTLNKNSRLTYSQKLFGKQRLVSLSGGEVYFEVVKNKAKPFVVITGDMRVTVLGTSFHVHQSPESIEVIVDAGLVRVEFRDQLILLKKDEKAVIDVSSGSIEKDINGSQLFRYYVDGKFVAESTALPLLVEALNKAYGSKIRIASERAQNMFITTTLEYGSLEKNLEVLRETLDLSVIRQGDNIIVE